MIVSLVPFKLMMVGRLVRVFMSLTLGLAGVAGAQLSQAPQLTISKCAILFAVGFLTASGGFALNDVQDIDRDGPGHRNPLGRGSLSLRFATAIAWSCLAAAILISVTIGITWFAVSCSQVALLLAYSKVKRWHGIYGNLLTAILCSSGLLYGSLFGSASPALVSVTVAAGLFVVGREILKDIVDFEDDLAAGLKTLPIRQGIRLATWTAVTICLLALPIAAYGLQLTRSFPIYLLALATFVVVAGILLWNARERSQRSLVWALNGTALTMLSIILISCLPG